MNYLNSFNPIRIQRLLYHFPSSPLLTPFIAILIYYSFHHHLHITKSSKLTSPSPPNLITTEAGPPFHN